LNLQQRTIVKSNENKMISWIWTDLEQYFSENMC
jgi:hypothetical protein